MSKKFNPYHQWLGIPKTVVNPTLYQLVGISPKEKDEDVIRAILLRQRNYIKGFLSGPHAGYARRLLNQLDQAEATILNASLRLEYDKKLKVYEGRRKKSNPAKGKVRRGSGGTRVTHQDSWLTREMMGVMSVLIGGFLILATITFFLPWERMAATKKQEELTIANDAEIASEPIDDSKAAIIANVDPAPDVDAETANSAESVDDLPAKTVKSNDAGQESKKPTRLNTEADFEILFDGSDLAKFRDFKSTKKPSKGWKIFGDSLKFDNEESGHLVVWQRYTNFDLRFDWRVEAKGNSGVIYRVDISNDQPHESGIEYQLLDDKSYLGKVKPHHLTGSLYDLFAPTGARVKTIGEWNSARIVVDGDHVEHWLNGVKVAEAEIGSRSWNQQLKKSKFKQSRNFAKLRLGRICFQEHGSVAWFRNIRIKNLLPENTKPKIAEAIIGDFRVRWTEENGNTGTVKYTFKESGAVLKDGRDYGEWKKQSDGTYRIRFWDRDRGTVTFKGSDKFDGTHTWSKITSGRKTLRWAGTRL